MRINNFNKEKKMAKQVTYDSDTGKTVVEDSNRENLKTEIFGDYAQFVLDSKFDEELKAGPTKTEEKIEKRFEKAKKVLEESKAIKDGFDLPEETVDEKTGEVKSRNYETRNVKVKLTQEELADIFDQATEHEKALSKLELEKKIFNDGMKINIDSQESEMRRLLKINQEKKDYKSVSCEVKVDKLTNKVLYYYLGDLVDQQEAGKDDFQKKLTLEEEDENNKD